MVFTPLNDVDNHLVYCENGSSIEKVMENGAQRLATDDVERAWKWNR